MFDGEFWLYAIPLMLVIFVALGRSGGKKEPRHKKQKKLERGDTIKVNINGKECRATLIDDPEPEKKKDRLKSAFGIPLE